MRMRARRAQCRAWLACGALVIPLVAIGCGGDGTTGPTATLPPSTTPAATASIAIYLPRGDVGTSCDRVFPVSRTVRSPAVLRGAMAALLRGPTAAERADGYGGWFSARTAGRLRRVAVTAGTARIDFRDFSRIVPNASSSCGSALLLAQLNRTATQFPTVRRAVYSFGGSPDRFYGWLQMDVPAG